MALTLGMVPEQAIELINNHNNLGGDNIGSPIGTDGLEDGAVSEGKIKDAAISTRTIQPAAVGKDKLDSEVLGMLLSVGSSKIPPVSVDPWA